MTQHIEENNTQTPIYSISNQQFLEAVFRTQANQVHVTVFHDDPTNIVTQEDRARAWAGGNWGNIFGRFQQRGNQYYTISTFHRADDGKDRRRKSLFKQCNVIVVDDVGLGLSAKVDPNDPRLPPPSFKLMTSPDNEQWGYILTLPEMSRHRVENILDGMVNAGLCDDFSDPGMKGVTRYVRLPEGTNNKEKYIEVLGAPFQCYMTLWNPENTIPIEKLAKGFGIDLDARRADKEGTTVIDSDHPALNAYAAIFGVKTSLGDGRYDVTCPKVHEHSDGDDSGAAIWTYPDGRLGFKCHHSHGSDLSGDIVLRMLYARLPTLMVDIQSYGSSFGPVVPNAPVTIDHETQAPTVDVMKLCEDLHFNPPQDAMNLAMAHVAAEPDPIRRETYILTIADKTNVSVVIIRQRINQMVSDAALPAEGGIPWQDININTGVPLPTRENFYLLMSHEGYDIRYNLMLRAIEVERPHSGYQVVEDAKKLALLTEIKSLMIRNGMRTDMAKEYRDYMAYCNSYHPFHQYLEAQVTLGGPYTLAEPDYLQQLCDSLVVAPDQVELRDKLVKTWMVSVVAAAYMTWDLDRRPVRGVLVLQGPQQMGKSHWFEKLLPPGMVKSGASINKNDMNHLKTCTNRLIVELAEAEFNSRNLDMVAYLKSIVGRSVDELRMAYDSEEVQLLRRSVFCITTNPGTFLVDDENSRYFTIPCQTITRDIYNMIPMSRLWAQVKAMYDAGIPYLLDEVTSTELQELNEEHRAKSRFEEWLLDSYHMDTLDGQDNADNWLTFTQILHVAQESMDVRNGEARDILKRLTQTTGTLSTHVKGSVGRWWKLPARRLYNIDT